MSELKTGISYQDAQAFAEERGIQLIVMLGFDPVHGEHVATWGATLEQADYAANAGNRLKQAIGWKPEDSNAVSAKVQKVIDNYQRLTEAIEEYIEQIDIKAFERTGDKVLNANEVSARLEHMLNQKHL